MRRARTRRITLGALLAALVLVGLGLGQALRDTTPPSLWIEWSEPVIAGQPLRLHLSADEPVTFQIAYGGTTSEHVEQELRTELTALPGEVPLRITATDAAGNVAEEARTVSAVVVPEATLEAPEALRPGDPYTVRVRFSPEDAPREDLHLTGGHVPLVAWSTREGAFALGAVPLDTDPGPVRFAAGWTDGLGRRFEASVVGEVVPLGQPVEELALSAATLSVITPEGRRLEEEALAAAEADATDPPRWKEPFLLPIEGRGTSGFGNPRRYAPGGPVSFHLGEDIAAPTGTEIRATNAGVVRLAGQYPIKGGLTVVDHGAGVTSRYYHQSVIHVAEGEAVARGEVIGEVGSTGLSTGPHLHWEMRVDDVPTDPLAWVDRSRP